jgi:hypothetical protein
VFAGRVPKIDEETLKILSEEALIVYIHYLDHLKQLFTNNIHQNLNAGKKVKTLFIIFEGCQLERH